MFVKVLTIIVALLVSAASSQHDTTDEDDVITCDAPTVERGHPGLLTCNFNVDVSTQRPVIVSVEHYPDNNDNGVNVLECTWMEAAEMKCQVRDGFKFDQRIGQQLQLAIPEASDVHAGRYVCSMMAKRAVSTPQPRPCRLSLAERKVPIAAVTTPVTTPAKEPEKNIDTEGPQRQDDDGDTPAWVVPVAVTVPVVAVVGGLVVALIYFRKCWCQGHKDTHSRVIEEEAEAAEVRGHQDGGDEKLSVDDERVFKRTGVYLGKSRADRSDVPVTRGNASARKEGQGDENEPLMPQDGALPSHVTETNADCIQDVSSLQTPEPNDVSEVPGQVTGSDDKSAEQGERPSTHVTSIPVGAQPEERSTNPKDSGFYGKGENSALGKGDDSSIGKGEKSGSYGKGEHLTHGKGDDSSIGKGEDSGSYEKGEHLTHGKGDDSSIGKGGVSGSYGKGENSTHGKGDDSSAGKGEDSGSYGKGENSAHGKGDNSRHGNGEDSFYGKGEDSQGKEEDSVLREGETSSEWKKRSRHIREFNRRSKGEIEMLAIAKQMKTLRLQE